MLPDIKSKVNSLLSLSSLPSLPSLPTNKKNLLKPLELSDIIVVMVEEQLSVDRTKQLKTFLTKNRKRTINLDPQEQLIKSAMQDVPDFARKQWGSVQLLKYLIGIKRVNPFGDIQLYTNKLAEIEKQFSNSLQKYKYELEEGKQSLEQIKQKVDSLYQNVRISHKYIKQTNNKIKRYCLHILVNIRRQQNLLKTIAIAKAWNKSNISKILSQNTKSIQNLQICKIMKEIDTCVKEIKLQGTNKELQNFDKVLKVIEDKRNLIIQKVQKNMLFSIVDFTDSDTYQKIFIQYNDLLRSLSWSNQQKFVEYHQLQKQNIQHMIQDNIDHLYWKALDKVSKVNNIQILGEDAYSNFFEKIVDFFSEYLIKWHKVTSFHVNSNSIYKDNFIKMLQNVSQKIIKKLFHLVKYSQKFFSLSFKNKVQIVIQIDRIVNFLQQWTGKQDISLFQVLRQKFRTQIQNFRKEKNGNIKILFVEQFSEQGLMPKIKRKHEQNQKQLKMNNLNLKNNATNITIQQKQSVQNIQQKFKLKQVIRKRLFPQYDLQNSLKRTSNMTVDKQNQQIHEENALKQKMKDQCRFKQKIKQLINDSNDLPLSKAFAKTISQYGQRQQILPFGHLEYIVEHFQFLILLIFKVCVYEQTKTKLIQDFNDKAFLKFKEVQSGINKNPFDDSLLHNLTKMGQSFIRRRNYLELHHFLAHQIQNKFDNLVISGFVNINKLYQNSQENVEALNSYHIKLSKLIEELLKISRWLVNNQSYFSSYEKMQKKLELMPTVLIQLGFLYFEQYNSNLYQKYVDTIEPFMKNLKWKVEKFNQETTQQFREYKINILQIYRSSTLNIGIKDKQLYEQLANKHLQVFYKALLYLYCKIDKINDNGRQVLRLDVIQIGKILQQVGYNPGSWAIWFQRFIEVTMQRSMKNILDKIQQLGVIYPIYCWRSHLLWIVNNFSTKQKKQYMINLLKIYIDQIRNIPQF